VLKAAGPSRLALAAGALRRGADGSGLAIESPGGTRTPVVILAPHMLDSGGALLAGADGTPLVREGQAIELVGGVAAPADPRYPSFLASEVIVLDG
jgi:hypothetical protein